MLVIGGGDTGSDCVGTAIRMGAREVHQFEILPKPPEWKEPWNPSWPAWPNILRTSSSQEEGCARDWSITTHRFTGEDGPGHEGQLRARGVEERGTTASLKMEEVPGSEFCRQGRPRAPGHGVRARDARQDHRGAGRGVRSAREYPLQSRLLHLGEGGFRRRGREHGASLVVRAIFHGREAARNIDNYLKG